jgi:hypothetical protein
MARGYLCDRNGLRVKKVTGSTAEAAPMSGVEITPALDLPESMLVFCGRRRSSGAEEA